MTDTVGKCRKVIRYGHRDDVPSIVKGGEKRMVSEWEELEKLSKDELIIELVKARTCYDCLRDTIEKKYVWPCPETLRAKRPRNPNKGQVAPPEWAEKIALYGAMHPRDGWFYSSDLADYGMNPEQAEHICSKLHSEGKLRLPDGVQFYISEGDVE